MQDNGRVDLYCITALPPALLHFDLEVEDEGSSWPGCYSRQHNLLLSMLALKIQSTTSRRTSNSW